MKASIPATTSATSAIAYSMTRIDPSSRSDWSAWVAWIAWCRIIWGSVRSVLFGRRRAGVVERRRCQRSMSAGRSHSHASGRPSPITLVSRECERCIHAPARRLQRGSRTRRHGRRREVPSVGSGPSGPAPDPRPTSAGTRRLTQLRRFHVQTIVARSRDDCRSGGVQYTRRIGEPDNELVDPGNQPGRQPGRPRRESIRLGTGVNGAERVPFGLLTRHTSRTTPGRDGPGVVFLCPVRPAAAPSPRSTGETADARSGGPSSRS